MKRYIKTPAFITVTAVLLVALISVSILAITLSIENSDLRDRLSALAIVSDKTDANDDTSIEADQKEEIKKENDSKLDAQTRSTKENLEIVIKATASKSEIEAAKKAISGVDTKTLIELEELLVAENSPHPTSEPNEKVCYLTFDDGPSDRTLEILEILEKHKVKATFFVVGTAKLQYLEKIKEKGHSIGIHTNSHVYSSVYKSTDAYFNDLNALSNKIYDKIGVHPKIMRFPGGGSNVTSQNYCKGIMTRLTNQVQIKGYGYFDWNVDSGDAASKNVSAKQIVNNVLTQAKKKNSICVLMHDTSSKKATVEALPEIIKGLKNQGFTFKALTKNSYGYHHTVKN